MNSLNFATVSLLLVLGAGGLMSDASPDNSAATSSADAPIDNLYEYLLQREYPSAIGYADHQIRRKAVRSPSLRLRFGKREPAQNEEIEEDNFDRIIRAPQLRLRFGKREPDLWSSTNDEENEDTTNDQNEMEDDEYLNQRTIRAPQLRLRYGRSFPMTNENANNFDLKRFFRRSEEDSKRAPQLRLRFGRSLSENNNFNDEDNMKRFSRDSDAKRAPTLRMRFGRSSPSGKADGDQ